MDGISDLNEKKEVMDHSNYDKQLQYFIELRDLIEKCNKILDECEVFIKAEEIGVVSGNINPYLNNQTIKLKQSIQKMEQKCIKLEKEQTSYKELLNKPEELEIE